MPGTERKNSRWLVSSVGRRHGLASGQVHNSAPGPNGTILAATPSGLAVHDGVGFTVYGPNEGLTTRGLRCVDAAPNGTSWIGSDIGFDFLDGNGNLHVPPLADQPGLVTSCLADDAGAWMAAARGLLRVHFDDRFEIEDFDVGDEQIVLLARDGRDHPIAVSRAGTLFRWTGNEWAALAHDEYRVCGAIRAVAADGKDTLSIGGPDGLAKIRSTGEILSFVKAAALPGPIAALVALPDELMAAVGGELVTLIEEEGRVVIDDVYQESGAVNHLWRDSEENVWASTESQGLLRISGLRRMVRFPAVPDIGAVYAIRPRRSGALLLAGEDGVVVPARRTEESARVVLRGVRTWDVLERRIGEVIAATDTGVKVVDDAGAIHALLPEFSPLQERSRSLIMHDGDLWVGTILGLFRVRGASATPVLADGADFGYVYGLSVDPEGRLVVATLGRGMWREAASGVFRPFEESPVSATSNVYAVAFGPGGQRAVVSDSHLHLQPGHGRPWRDIALTSSTWAVDFGFSGEIFLGTSGGLMVHDGETGALLRQVRPAFDEESWEFTTSRAMVRTASGSLLCGLTMGLAEIDTAALMAVRSKPVPYLAGVDWVGAEPLVDDNSFVVGTGRWSATITIRSAWRVDEPECRIECRLDGFEVAWLREPATARFRYTSLPVGEYTIMGRVHSPIAGTGPETPIGRFRVTP